MKNVTQAYAKTEPKIGDELHIMTANLPKEGDEIEVIYNSKVAAVAQVVEVQTHSYTALVVA